MTTIMAVRDPDDDGVWILADSQLTNDNEREISGDSKIRSHPNPGGTTIYVGFGGDQGLGQLIKHQFVPPGYVELPNTSNRQAGFNAYMGREFMPAFVEFCKEHALIPDAGQPRCIGQVNLMVVAGSNFSMISGYLGASLLVLPYDCLGSSRQHTLGALDALHAVGLAPRDVAMGAMKIAIQRDIYTSPPIEVYHSRRGWQETIAGFG